MAHDPPALGTLVAVDWLDAHANVMREQTIEEIATEELAQYTTYGILVRDDTTAVAVAGDVRGTIYRGVTFIPRGMIARIVSRQRQKRRKKPDTAEHPPEQRSNDGS